MLKRLELVGFKSFADKTQFDFTGGITAIVGPNGSGKSNIVDAVRWILGEQSAKSLRGGEMADVIFNGSASRKSFGMAEVTMTFDNSRQALAIDASEVQITRRVYRSGEGEYLINGQLCRLKDIKDLFLGSGAGTNAYCIIEQGRVDVLLQASTKDRRMIFEEAAGISRFKAKKIETLRKLERVDQNLQRLRDIMTEVDKQLRSVKLQAAKAQRYQEHSQRLQELRVALGLQDFLNLTERLQSEETILAELQVRLAARTNQASSDEAELAQMEEKLAELDAQDRQLESRLTDARQRIAAEEATLAHEQAMCEEVSAERDRIRRHLIELSGFVAELTGAAAVAEKQFEAADTQCNQQRQNVHVLTDALQSSTLRIGLLNRQLDTDRGQHIELVGQAIRLKDSLSGFEETLSKLHRERERLLAKNEQVAEHLTSLDLQLRELVRAEEMLQARMTAARQSLANRRQEREQLGQQADALTQRVSDLRAERTGLSSRVEVLEGLERSQEGLGTGVREVFALLAQPEPGPWRTVRGMVADLVTVEREYAPLIDLALGERAQRFVVEDQAILHQALQQRSQAFSGRVGFLPLDRSAASIGQNGHSNGQHADDEGIPAAQLVTWESPDLAPLADKLLGNTRIVRDLDTARALASRQPGLRLVTRQGELLEPDGSLIVGTHHAESGILSRKSELRDLRQQGADLDREIATAEQDLSSLREKIALLQNRITAQQEEIDGLGEQASDLKSRVSQQRERREGLQEEVVLNQSEIEGREHEIQALEQTIAKSRIQAEDAEKRVQELEQRIDSAKREMAEREQRRVGQEEECTAAKVALAQIEERLTALRNRHRQLQTDWQQRRLEQAEGEKLLASALTRLNESEHAMLNASATLAEVYVDKEAAEQVRTHLSAQRTELWQQRHALTERTQGARSEWQALQSEAHGHDLQASNLRQQRDNLSERLQEDYQVNLAELYQQFACYESRIESTDVDVSPEETDTPPAAETDTATDTSVFTLARSIDAAEANEEIDELRKKLSRLGSVNLDSLQELAELELRAGSLQGQFDDLAAAQKTLQEIIHTINTDSRRLFSETFVTIRGHFQELFRKLFGGGMADIVLEDENDILECGIEIIARPPGKELRSISLMSGGEKTMTAVALLLAIFRSKPSPFCLLDEVDAALDEANIGRFTAVVRDFLDRSQFIIITHSKKTMSCADVLYGITMQESGISKRVAVRFEDWPDDADQAAATPIANGA